MRQQTKKQYKHCLQIHNECSVILAKRDGPFGCTSTGSILTFRRNQRRKREINGWLATRVDGCGGCLPNAWMGAFSFANFCAAKQ